MSPRSKVLPRPESSRAYTGTRRVDGSVRVTVDGSPLPVRSDLSGTQAAFDWGYAGPGGPTQLAWALLVSHLGQIGDARRWCDHFLHSVVRNLTGPEWSLSSAEISRSLPDSAR